MLALLLPLPSSAQDVVINEFMASNGSTIMDEDGEFHDWIELFNRSDEPVNLEGWGLSDNADNPFKWRCPDVTVGPGGFLLVWASGKDRKPESEEPQEPRTISDLPGLVLWLRADAEGYSDNEPVAQWTDQSGRGNHAVQSEAARRPRFRTSAINSLPALEFNRSVSQWLHLPAADFAGMTDLRNLTFVSLISWKGATVSGIFGTPFSGTSSGNAHFEIRPGGQLRLRVGSMNDLSVNGAVSTDRWSIVAALMDSANDSPVARVFVDGSLEGTRQQDPGDVSLNHYTQVRLGDSHSDRAFDGLIAEVFLFNQALNAEDRQVVERHLREKYQLGAPIDSSPLHTNFRISAAGERLLLTRPDGTRMDEVEPVAVPRDVSYGRSADGSGEWVFFLEPTPAGANTTQGYSAPLAPPAFSHPRGFYEEPFSVALESDREDASIYYTTDGSTPSESNGLLYSGPIPITSTATLRAVSSKPGALPVREAASHTYLFLEHVLNQADNPAGWPSQWGDWGITHYGMAPEVVQHGSYSGRMIEALTAAPTLSITMDMDDLFGPNGLYARPTQRGLEKPASVELIYPDGRPGFQVDCGIRVQGGASRQPHNTPKKSLRLLFKNMYGPSRLVHPFMTETGTTEMTGFNTMILRAEYNNEWLHWSGTQRARGLYFRDQWVRDTQIALSGSGSSGTHVHLYINGLYWGLYNPSERPDAAFAASYFGGEREDYDAMTHGGVRDGNAEAWNTMRSIAGGGLASNAGYEAIQQYLDVPHFIGYMIANFYPGMDDWPHNNWNAVRKREPGAGFKFYCWDSERSMEGLNNNRTGVTGSNNPAEFYAALRQNAEFRLLFADHVHRHFFNDGALTVEAVTERFLRLAARVEAAVVAESARWGTYRRDKHSWREAPYELYTRNSHWQAEYNRLLNTYLPARTGIVLSQFRSAGLYPGTDAPVFSPRGAILEGIPLTMNAPSGGTIHYTTNGEDPRVYGSGAVSPHALLYSQPLTLQSNTIIKARVLGNGQWSALNEGVFVIPPVTPHELAEGPYVFTQWNADSPAGTYPPNMIFEQAQQRDSKLASGMEGYWTLPYNLTGRSRINGLGSGGIAFINTASTQEDEGAGHPGSALLGLDTREQEEIRVQWMGGTVTPNERVYGLRLQYRAGASGAFRDVLDSQGKPVEYLRNETAGHVRTLGPVLLPPAAANQPYVELRWKYYHVAGTSGPRAQLRLDNIRVQTGPLNPASHLLFDTVPQAHGQVGPLPVLVVRAVNAELLTDPSFSGPITITLQGDGVLSGTTTVNAVNGVALFENLAVNSSGTFSLRATSGLLQSTPGEAFSLVRLTELIMPRFIQGEQDANGGNFNRVPFACLLRLEGLASEATYRYGNRVVTAGDGPGEDGAGNMIFVTGAEADWIRNTDSPRFNALDFGERHHTFTTNAEGSYTGWFVTEPTGNPRFTPGDTVFLRLLLSDGAGGEETAYSLTTTSGVTVLPFGEDPEAGSALIGTSEAGPRSFVVLHEDESGEGRPLAATPVEITGSEIDERYAAFYHQIVAGNPGYWGTLIPNNLSGGVRRIEERSVTSGSLLKTRTAAGGFPGTVHSSNNVNPVLLDIDTSAHVFLPGGSGNWTDDINWSSGVYPNGIGASAVIGAPAGADRNVDLRAPVTVGELSVQNAVNPYRNRIRDRDTGNRLMFEAADGPARLAINGSGSGFVEFQVEAGTLLASDVRIEVNHITEGLSNFGALRLRERWSGPGGLIKAGPGEVSLTGAGKDYTGETVIEQGVLRVTESATAAATSGVRVLPGGQLRLTSSNNEQGGRVYSFGGSISLNSLGRGGDIPMGEEMGVLGALRYDPVSNDNQAIVTNPIILEGDSHVHVDGTRNLLDLSGPVTGGAWIVKSGGGALWLSGEGAGFSGGIDVMTGALNVSGNFAGTLIALRQEAVLEGSGRVGPIGGNGTVAPGPGPSVLAADSAGARNYVLQFSRTAPDYAAPAGSGNDVLRLTQNSPFPAAFTGANRIALYFNVGTIRSGDIFRGGFFTDSENDFLPRINSAQWALYVADPDGPAEYEGQTYRIFDGHIQPVVDTVTETADFGLGPVTGRSLRIRFGDGVTSFETWRAANFLAPDLNDPEISGPSADPLEMGVPNLLRYAWGLTFDEPVQGSLPEMRLLEGEVEFSFRMAPENMDLAHLVFVSEDLKEWRVVFDSDQEPALVVDEGRLRLVFALEDSNGERVPARFFRLGVLLKEQI